MNSNPLQIVTSKSKISSGDIKACTYINTDHTDKEHAAILVYMSTVLECECAIYFAVRTEMA